VAIRVRHAGVNQIGKRSARGGLDPSEQQPTALNLPGETIGRNAMLKYFSGRPAQIHDVRKVLAEPMLIRLAS